MRRGQTRAVPLRSGQQADFDVASVGVPARLAPVAGPVLSLLQGLPQALQVLLLDVNVFAQPFEVHRHVAVRLLPQALEGAFGSFEVAPQRAFGPSQPLAHLARFEGEGLVVPVFVVLEEDVGAAVTVLPLREKLPVQESIEVQAEEQQGDATEDGNQRASCDG